MPEPDIEDPRAAIRALLSAEEAERQRIAHELHSEIGQDLTAALLGLQFFAEAGIPADEVPELIGSVRRALERVRALSLRLRPPLLEEIGLEAALRSSLGQIADQRGLSLALVFALECRPDALTEVLLFRALQDLAVAAAMEGPLILGLRSLDAETIELSLEGADASALQELVESLQQRLALLRPSLSSDEKGWRLCLQSR
jgi:signal transduction histidine kinase